MDEIQNALRWVAVATIALYLVVASIAIVGYLDARSRAADNRTFAAQTRTALCTLRSDLVRRVTVSEEFLKTHPEGFAGISAAVIRQGINNQQSTIDALDNLNCDSSEK